VHLGRVLHRDHVFARTTGEAERGDRRSGIAEQPGAKLGVTPRAGHDLGTVPRPDPGLIGIDQ